MPLLVQDEDGRFVLGGQVQQGRARCQPQSESDQVKNDPPRNAIYDVVVFCIHNPPLLVTCWTLRPVQR